MTENNSNCNIDSLTILEAVLFAASSPVPYAQLAEVMECSVAEVRRLSQELSQRYLSQQRGIRLQFHEDRVKLVTAPETSDAIERFLGIESSQKLSRAAQETLTIVAYRQPVSRPAIDLIRGVNSDSVLRGLMNRGLIEEAGRAETPGRPVLYATTQDFLLYFGLTSIKELPPFDLDLSDPKDQRILKE